MEKLKSAFALFCGGLAFSLASYGFALQGVKEETALQVWFGCASFLLGIGGLVLGIVALISFVEEASR